MSVSARELASGLTTPWSLGFLPDGRLLVTERSPGRLLLMSATGQTLGVVSGLPATAGLARNQAGLLDVVIDPDFARTRRIFLSYTEVDASDPQLSGVAVASAVLDVQGLSLSEVSVLYRALPKVDSVQNYGSRLAIDRSGNLFVTLGDRYHLAQREYAQSLARAQGKVVRILPVGGAAPGNPVWTAPDAQPEIFSLGHRNPQGAAIHPLTGDLWISEHGAQGGDEINRILPGRNYGWPLATRAQEYETTQPIGAASLPGMEDPAWVWETIDGTPYSTGMKSSTAPAGMAFYFSDVIPQWKGSLFVGALAGRALWRLSLDGNTVTRQERLLTELSERLRDVEVGPDGALYLLTDSGRLLRYGR